MTVTLELIWQLHFTLLGSKVVMHSDFVRAFKFVFRA
jgi:hypothetical protein